jgi:hypothetical protein
MPDQSTPISGRAREAALRERRRAEALRANLRRRKDQARARDDGGADVVIVATETDAKVLSSL